MAKRTIPWPPVPSGGRVALTPDPATAETTEELDAALRQIIRLSVLDGRSSNPWLQRLKLGVDDPTWTAATEAAAAQLRARITTAFDRLTRQRRARLVSVAVTRPAAGRLDVAIIYQSLETGERRQLEVSRDA